VTFTFRFGKHFGRGRLSAEQQAVVDRLEKGEITAGEAQKLLGGTVRVFDVSIGNEPEEANEDREPVSAEETDETSEERKARELIERIAREVDEETGR
jgi:hypothetical protein